MYLPKPKNILSKLKSFLPKKKLKVDDIVTIEDRGKFLEVTVKKDALINIDGNVLTVVKGLNVTLAKEIHLNPRIQKSMENLDSNINEYKIKRLEEAKKSK